MNNTYYIYMLIAYRNKRVISYVGYTNNLDKRLLLHNSSKGAKFTRGNKWFLAYKKKIFSKSQALKEEYLLKNDKNKRLIIKKKFLKNENNNFTSL